MLLYSRPPRRTAAPSVSGARRVAALLAAVNGSPVVVTTCMKRCHGASSRIARSSAQAKCVISPATSQMPSCCNCCTTSMARSGTKPKRFMPVLTLTHTRSGRPQARSHCSWCSERSTTSSCQACASSSSRASMAPSSSRMGAWMPAWRSAMASSRLISAKPSASGSACATRNRPWP
ncbi:hypothetical protein D3C78_1479820 [compost metagenome]